ncbi:4a-hydroxytetrahydrobiopterin dehydratase [Verrucomicrobiota bacterium]
MSNFCDTKCEACSGDAPALTDNQLAELIPQVPEWELAEKNGIKQLKRIFKFKNFAEALEFTNKIGALAESQNHHPSITTQWGRVTVTWYTHKIKGLHRNDFVMAAKTDILYG